MFPADKIKTLRRDANLTQSELANKLGIDRTTLSKYENGERRPDMAALCTISDFFGVSVSALIGRSETYDLFSLLSSNSLLSYNGKRLSQNERSEICNAIGSILNKRS